MTEASERRVDRDSPRWDAYFKAMLAGLFPAVRSTAERERVVRIAMAYADTAWRLTTPISPTEALRARRADEGELQAMSLRTSAVGDASPSDLAEGVTERVRAGCRLLRKSEPQVTEIVGTADGLEALAAICQWAAKSTQSPTWTSVLLSEPASWLRITRSFV